LPQPSCKRLDYVARPMSSAGSEHGGRPACL
jgi:hypothetical protein